MTSFTKENWLKAVDTALAKLDEKPQFSLPHPFPLQEVEGLLKKLFSGQDLTLGYQEKGWVEPLAFWEGLPEEILGLAIELTPLEPPLYFVLGHQDVTTLMSDLLAVDASSSFVCDPAITSGFYHYIALEVLQVMETSQFAHPLAPRLGPAFTARAELALQESAFVVDVSLALKNKSIWGRVFVSSSFRVAWKKHLAPQPLISRLRQDIPLELCFEVGHTEIMQKEYEALSLGDFLLLSSCSFDPEQNRGSVVIKLADIPLFRGKIKKEGIEIAEYPRYEAGESMEKDDTPEEIPGQMPAENPIEAPPEEPTPRPPMPSPIPPEAATKVEQLPLQLKVEVGRVTMTLAELSALSVGNLLDLQVAPEQGVDLVVGGKKVGRGELIKIGENLGVRIISF